MYSQTNVNVVVRDKFRVINSEEIGKTVARYNSKLINKGRLMIRASGTEPKIRVMVESNDSKLNESIAREIIELINFINEAN